MVSEVTAIKRQAHINQGQVNWIADKIVDDDRRATHPQAVVHKFHYLLRVQMMSKQAATHQIKTSVCERKSHRISGHRRRSISRTVFQMRRSAVEQRDLKMDSQLQ